MTESNMFYLAISIPVVMLAAFFLWKMRRKLGILGGLTVLASLPVVSQGIKVLIYLIPVHLAGSVVSRRMGWVPLTWLETFCFLLTALLVYTCVTAGVSRKELKYRWILPHVRVETVMLSGSGDPNGSVRGCCGGSIPPVSANTGC